MNNKNKKWSQIENKRPKIYKNRVKLNLRDGKSSYAVWEKN